PVAQLAAALSLAAFTATIFHLAFETLTTSRWSLLFRLIWRTLGIWGVLSMVAWALLRARQTAFAADIVENPLGQFLNWHPFLAAVFYIFITLGAPLAAAGALTYSSSHIRDAVRLQRAERRVQYLRHQLPKLTKALESEKESLTHGLKATEKKCGE